MLTVTTMALIQRTITCCIVVILKLNYGDCEAEFEMFPGFESNIMAPSEDLHNVLDAITTIVTTTIAPNITIKPDDNQTTPYPCPEDEKPSNIGPYEVPTQRDLVNHMKARLLKLFNRYHAKALTFLKDIKEATRSTSEIARRCPRDKETYKKCVRHVNNQCQLIVKTLVSSLEYQRHDVLAVTQGPICNLTTMKADPVELIKILAMEEASLEFALPGFLRLLNSCTLYCNIVGAEISIKPSRHMTDQDLVIKHFLTRKNYLQLIKPRQFLPSQYKRHERSTSF